MIDMQALAAPFDPARISWRVGSTTGDKKKGMALAYCDARDIMDRLDAVCGPANWQDRYEFHGSRTVCYLSVRIGDEWITKADGAGDSDVEAEKGAISDALKRAAVKWGIGRYLYDLDSPWVEIEAAGRSFRIKPSEVPKLIRALGGRPVQAVATEKQAETPKLVDASKYVTDGGFERKAGDRLSPEESTSVLNILKDGMRFARNAPSVREWLKTNNPTINSLVDADYDTFRTDLEEYKEGLPKEQVAA